MQTIKGSGNVMSALNDIDPFDVNGDNMFSHFGPMVFVMSPKYVGIGNRQHSVFFAIIF